MVAQAGNSAGAGGTIVRADALIAVPWANHGGTTRVIADRPQFRLSLATIAGEGPFSSLPGLVRHFALVAGRVELSVFPTALDAASPPVTFSGDALVYAVPLDGPALALNLMVPAGAGPLRLERCAGGTLVDVVAVFACDCVTVGASALGAHDTLFPDGPVYLSGRALVVR